MTERKPTLADQIRAHAAGRAAEFGLNPGAVVGLIEEASSFAPVRSDGGRLGLFGVPASAVVDAQAYLSDWRKQVDSAVVLLAQAKAGAGKGTDLGAMVSFLGADEAAKRKAVRAYVRGTKYSGEPINTVLLGNAYRALGVQGDARADLKAAGIAPAQQRVDRATLLSLAKEHAPGIEDVVDAIAGIESAHGTSPKAYVPNGSGVIGPMQIMAKATGGRYANFEKFAAPGLNDPHDPVHSSIAGMRMLSNLVAKNKGDAERAAMEYFTGRPNPPASASDGIGTAGQYLAKFRAGREAYAKATGGRPSAPSAPSAPSGVEQPGNEPGWMFAQARDEEELASMNASDQDALALLDEEAAEFASADAEDERAATLDERLAAVFGGDTSAAVAAKAPALGFGLDEFVAGLAKEEGAYYQGRIVDGRGAVINDAALEDA